MPENIRCSEMSSSFFAGACPRELRRGRPFKIGSALRLGWGNFADCYFGRNSSGGWDEECSTPRGSLTRSRSTSWRRTMTFLLARSSASFTRTAGAGRERRVLTDFSTEKLPQNPLVLRDWVFVNLRAWKAGSAQRKKKSGPRPRSELQRSAGPPMRGRNRRQQRQRAPCRRFSLSPNSRGAGPVRALPFTTGSEAKKSSISLRRVARDTN